MDVDAMTRNAASPDGFKVGDGGIGSSQMLESIDDLRYTTPGPERATDGECAKVFGNTGSDVPPATPTRHNPFPRRESWMMLRLSAVQLNVVTRWPNVS